MACTTPRCCAIARRLFQYNLGVVYYRLGRYDDAVEALRQALSDSELAAIATYNLGLVEVARGDTDAASAAFAAVIEMGPVRTLRRSARDALVQLAADKVTSGGVESRAEPTAAEPAAGFRFSATASYAQDSNVYRAPSEDYVDLSDPAEPLVTPVVYSAAFMPIDLNAAYVMTNEAEDTEFLFSYLMNGDFYDSEFANATRLSQRFSIGADIDLDAKDDRRRRLRSSFYMGTHEETNYNPDDGLDRSLDGTDVADRLSYRGGGIDADYLHEFGRVLFGFEVDYQRRQYEDVLGLPSFDHEIYDNRAFVDVAINSRTEVGLGLGRMRRSYDERLARELTGEFSAGSDFVEYDYQDVELAFRRMLGPSLLAEVGVSRQKRVDAYVGYNDYLRDGTRVGINYQPSDRLYVQFGAAVYAYDYPNAFAFNNPVAGARQLDVNRIDILMDYALTSRLTLSLSAFNDSSSATDTREEYDLSIASLGIRWRLQD